MVSRKEEDKIIAPHSLSVRSSFSKKEKGEREFIYLLCPGGAAPGGFWFSVCCVCPEPVHVGC
jgi:hypothetical protein